MEKGKKKWVEDKQREREEVNERRKNLREIYNFGVIIIVQR